MKIIKILGTGCPNCNTTELLVQKVINDLKSNAVIEKVDDIQEIMMYDIMSTPAIVIDEKVVIKGRVPSEKEVRELLQTGCCNEDDSSCCDDDDGSCCNEDDSSCCNDEGTFISL